MILLAPGWGIQLPRSLDGRENSDLIEEGDTTMEHLMLKIDLSNQSYKVEEIPCDIIRKYIGGRGLGAYLLYRFVPPKTDPLGEENCLIFTAGPASGTSLFYSSKANVNTKSPLTGIYLYSISRDSGPQIRRADTGPLSKAS
jgi:aldehyde:ferredoxin oxidoreductase